MWAERQKKEQRKGEREGDRDRRRKKERKEGREGRRKKRREGEREGGGNYHADPCTTSTAHLPRVPSQVRIGALWIQLGELSLAVII